jgi:hypothetical protein
MVGGSLRVLRLLPPLKLVAMIAEILLKVALNTTNQNQIKSNQIIRFLLPPYMYNELHQQVWS